MYSGTCNQWQCRHSATAVSNAAQLIAKGQALLDIFVSKGHIMHLAACASHFLSVYTQVLRAVHTLGPAPHITHVAAGTTVFIQQALFA